jgi:hypothetical protein
LTLGAAEVFDPWPSQFLRAGFLPRHAAALLPSRRLPFSPIDKLSILNRLFGLDRLPQRPQPVCRWHRDTMVASPAIESRT